MNGSGKRNIARLILLFFAYFILTTSCTNEATQQRENEATEEILSGFSFQPLTQEQISEYRQAVEEFYDSMLGSKGFNGSILVAKQGQVVFESYKGYHNFQTKDTLTSTTPLHLASISKTFTGIAILKLYEDGKIALTDTIQKFFPRFPYQGVTIEMLLNHRSGLPNYLYFMDSLWDKQKKASNNDVLQAMIQHKPALNFKPGTRFNYSNTNFMLLALVIEKISTQPFPEYMKEHIFQPLGMQDTYVFSMKDTVHYVPTYSVSKPFPMDQYDCTYGDKNVYSTPRDLLKYDRQLYGNDLLQQNTKDIAFTPYSHEKKTMHNYGLGWRLLINENDTLIYHNGKWHGSYTVFNRFVQDTATIIILSNKQNSNVYHAKKMSSLLSKRALQIMDDVAQ